MNPSTWPQPHGEEQISHGNLHQLPVDSDGCVSYGTTHLIESQGIFLSDNTQYSERFLAKISGTTNQGNWVKNVFDAVAKFGMVPDSLWPEPAVFTWQEYYADIPQNVIDAGQDFLRKYNVSYRLDIPLAELPQALEQGPVLAILVGPGMNHAVELLNSTTIFDSYAHAHDAAGNIDYTEQLSYLEAHNTYIESIHQLLITPKNMALAKKTLNLDGEIGVFISVSDPASLPDLNTAFGVNVIPNPDGSIPTDVVAHKQ